MPITAAQGAPAPVIVPPSQACPIPADACPQTIAAQPVAAKPPKDVFEKAYGTLYTVASATPILGAGVNATQFITGFSSSRVTSNYMFPTIASVVLNLVGTIFTGNIDPTVRSALPAALCLGSAGLLGAVTAYNSMRAKDQLVDPKAGDATRPWFNAAYTTGMAALSAVPVVGAATNAAQLFRSEINHKTGAPAFSALVASGFGTAAFFGQWGTAPTALFLGTASLLGGIAAYHAARNRTSIVG